MYRRSYPDGEPKFVARVFEWIADCFSGKFADYQPVDTKYHDFEHTLQGTLCLVRLLGGRFRAKARPVLSQSDFENCLLGILFHDTGYLKEKSDPDGTGAKYTAIHVMRGCQFAREFLAVHGIPERRLTAIQNMIRCTGADADFKAIPFNSEEEKIAGFALSTSDLLGQMAAADYVDKLPLLYLEFAEAARYTPEWGNRYAAFKSADQLVRNTPAFWDNYVWARINDDFGRLYTFLNDPYPNGENPYLRQIERNLQRIRERTKL